ncbi:hypothetical protein [Bradyrhizobium elkanii]|uniref:hypothetical protein n=1 Tax=Bradyrhizobium elkanii TaxID=29448 RepID=UPI003510F13A
MSRLAIRVQHHPNGTSTIAGVPTRYMRIEKQHKAKPTDPDLNDPWLSMMRPIVDILATTPPYRHGYEDVPVTQLDKSGRFCRLRAVRQQRESRLRVAEVMDMIFASIKQRQQP